MSFLQKQKSSDSKCKLCVLKCEKQIDNSLVLYKGTGDILFIVDIVETKEMIEKLEGFLDVKGIVNYQIHTATLCRPKSLKFSVASYRVYNYCRPFDLSKIDYKVAVTFGRAINYIINSDDINYWGDFVEFQFNRTYFIDKGKRIYPCPSIHEFLGKDNFRRFFVKTQLEFITEYLIDYKPERISRYKIEIVDDPNEFLTKYKDVECEVAWDTETNSLNHFIDDFKVGCLTLTFDGVTGYYLDMSKVNKRLLSQFFKNKYQILANGKYDVKALKRLGIFNCKVDEDIILLSHILSTERSSNGLKSLAWLIGMGGYDSALDDYKNKYKIKNYLDIPKEILSQYATLDAIATYRIYKLFMNEYVPKQPDIYKMYKEYLIPVLPVFIKAEMHGMNVDVEYLNKYNQHLIDEINKIKNNLCDYLGMSIKDINSGQKLGKRLEELGLPEAGKTKKGFYKTGKQQISEWKRKGFEIAGYIEDFKKLNKLREAFVGEVTDDNFFSSDEKVGLNKFITSDNKVHCNFGVAMTRSLRAVCSSPNLQQIPKHSNEAKLYRKVYIAPEDYYLCESDYSGFQLRIACIHSEDKAMLNIFNNLGGDMHSITGNGVFCRDVPIDEFLKNKGEKPYKIHRQKAKCFVKGTKILTNKGLMLVEEFIPAINNGFFTPYLDKDVKLVDRFNNVKDIESTYYDEVFQTIEIQMENGDVIEVSPEHEFPIIRGGVEIKIMAKDLLETDELVSLS